MPIHRMWPTPSKTKPGPEERSLYRFAIFPPCDLQGVLCGFKTAGAESNQAGRCRSETEFSMLKLIA
jgi:hypothetical protein